MADRYAFQSPFAHNDRDGWFTIGTVAVTTTVALSGLALIGVVLLVLEGNNGPVGRNLVLTADAIARGHLWRLFTWPVAITSSVQIFGQILSAVFFYMLGSQFESILGKRRFVSLVGALLLVPAILAIFVSFLTGIGFGETGLGILFMGVAAGFAAAFTQAKSFFGIPFWVLIAAFFTISLLSLLTERNWPALVMLVASGGIGLVLTRSFGFASEVEWIPVVALPAAFTGEGATASAPRSKKKRNKNKAGLRSVSTGPAASEAEIDALLDQMNDQGFDSLSKQQKATLKRHSEEMRRRRDLE